MAHFVEIVLYGSIFNDTINLDYNYYEGEPMRRRITALAVVFALMVSMLGIPATETSAAYSVPDTVRVGLYFTGHDSGNGPVSSIKISNSSGVMLAVSMGAYTMELGPRYDKYVVCEKMAGTYHLCLSSDYDTYAAAVVKQQSYADMGVSSVIVYDGSWAIWSGQYTSQSAAETAGANIKALGLTYSIVSPSSYRIGCVVDNKLTFIFDVSGSGLLVCPTTSGYLTLNDTSAKTYRGNMEIRRNTNSDMTVINVVPLDQYLYGVVPNEIGANVATEALKAQAVAARSFITRSMNKYPKYNFDVSDTVQDQVYKGVPYESTACNNAVNATSGQIVWYNGAPAETFYFSCANGFTEDVRNVFGSPVAYLKSVDSTFESPNSYLHTWTITYSAASVKALLAADGVNIGNITNVKVNTFTEAGRVTSITFEGTSGSKTYTNNKCRFVMDLYSQQFTVEVGNGDGTATLYYPITAAASNSITTVDPVSSATVTTKTFIRTITYTNLLKAIDGDLKEIDGHNLIFANLNGSPFTGHYLNDYVGTFQEPDQVVDTFFKTTLPYTGQVGTKTVVSTLAKGTVRFSGKGWGHAVGMSQDGAIALAEKGYSYVKILEHYYPGATVK